MKIIVKSFYLIFPTILLVDMLSGFFQISVVTNLGRLLRIFLLVVFLIENIRLYSITKYFVFSRYFLFYGLFLFFRIPTDIYVMTGFWEFSKLLYSILGINVLYAYLKIGVLDFDEYFDIIKICVYTSIIFTVFSYITGLINEDYNLAAYFNLFITPILLYRSGFYKKDRLPFVLSMFSILATLKRGAILAFFLANISFIVLNIKKFKLKQTIVFIIVSIFLFQGISLLINNRVNSSSNKGFQNRFAIEQFDVSNPETSDGRAIKYIMMVTDWYDSGNYFLGFGNRAYSYSHDSPNRLSRPHSDIFGHIYEHGLVGLLFILGLYFKILYFYLKLRKFDKNNSSIIIVFLVILFLTNLYSGVMYSTNLFFLLSILPLIQSDLEKKLYYA
jgi:hypothetical protein